MVVIENRKKKEFLTNENFKQDMFDSLVEIAKLEEYYKAEVKQLNIELLDPMLDLEYRPRLEGKLEAYTDHIEEVTYIRNMMLGRKHDNRNEAI